MEPANCPCPHTYQTTPSPLTDVLNILFNIISKLCVGLLSYLFHSDSPTKTLMHLSSPTHATCPAHLLFITQIIFRK
jgi:hypothetical protein